jgi:predicted permease
LPWAIALGVLASATGARLPGPLESVVRMLADAASPVALFTIGAVLARSQFLAAQGEHEPMPWGDYLPVVFVKLLVHPALVWSAGSIAIAMGLPLSRFALNVMVLVAALPSASNVALLTERFWADTGRIARIILLTTAAAFFTFSAAVALLK